LSGKEAQTATDAIKGQGNQAVNQNEPVTVDALKSTFAEYVKSTDLSPPVKMILKNPFELQEGVKVVFPIKNQVEISMMKRIEQELLALLRASLSNSSLKFVYDVQTKTTETKPYTNTEIFNAMAKKNPALLKLKDTLGLDTDF